MGATPLFSRVSFKKEEQAGEVEQEEAAGGVVDGRVCQMENSEEKDGDQGDRAAGEIKALAEEPASHPSVLIDGLKGARVRRGLGPTTALCHWARALHYCPPLNRLCTLTGVTKAKNMASIFSVAPLAKGERWPLAADAS